jgi:ribosomal protein L29
MATKKTNDITTKSDADLRKEIEKQRDGLRTLKGVFGAQGNDVKAIKNHKRIIAQIQTELSARAKKAVNA